MPRSVWKGPFVDGYLLKKAENAHGSERREVIKTFLRVFGPRVFLPHGVTG